MKSFQRLGRQLLAVILLLLIVPACYAGPWGVAAYATAGVGAVLYAHARFQLPLSYGFSANTITNLIPILYQALDVVVRELVGMIPACSRDIKADRIGINQNVNVYVAPSVSTSNIVPGQLPPDDGDQAPGNVQVTITKSKYAPVRWSGEEQLIVAGTGVQTSLLQDQFTQAMRALVNEVEADLAVEGYKNASRSFGTAGAPPFGTSADLTDSAGVFKILDDNGIGKVGRQLVLGTSAMANIRGKQAVLFKVNEAGTDELLRQGIVGRLQGFDLRDSAGIPTPAKGTGAAYTSTAAGFAIGTTQIPLITGTGTILQGDTITFAGDTNKYVVQVGIAAPGTITIGAPGLRQALPASAQALTVGNVSAQNLAFTRSSIVLAARMPAMPDGGDSADDILNIQDPYSGLMFQVALYRLYRRIKFEIGLAWGVRAIKQEGISVLLG